MAAAGVAGAGLAAGGWLPTTLLTPADAAAVRGALPPGFPTWLPLHKRRYENWSGEVAVDGVWTVAPRTPGDVVAVANWAWTSGYQVRPRGYMHNWAPYTVTNDQSGDSHVVLVDTTRHLSAVTAPRSPRVARPLPSAVRTDR
jgi:FAD/FMN-containing dehydrogenase